jgi:hypothetical protein
MNSKVKPEEITLEDIKVCINIIEIFRRYYETIAIRSIPKSEKDLLMALISHAMRTASSSTTTQKAETEAEEIELDEEMLDKLRKKYKIKQEQKA